MSQALCFNDVTLTPITHQNSIWIKASELARALGYKREDQVAKIYRNNADEFTQDMTQVVEIVDNADLAFPVKTRIFSLRGCHLIAMFARTAVAKAFRRWVLDVLDKLAVEAPAAQPALPSTATPSTAADRKPLTNLVKVWARQANMYQSQAWYMLNGHFNITSVTKIPLESIPAAIAFVEGKINALAKLAAKEEQKALPEAAQLPALSKKDLPSTARLFEDIRKAEKILEGTENWTHIKVRLELCREVDLYTFERSVDMHINAAWYALGLAKSSLLAALTVGRISKEFTPNGTARV